MTPANVRPDLTACLDYPESGKSAGELFFVQGWAFSRTRGIAAMYLRHPSGTTFPLERIRRPDVGAAFPGISSAAQSGFSSVEPIRCRLEAGTMEVVVVFEDGSEHVVFCFPFTGPAPKPDDYSVSADFLRARRELAGSRGGLCVLFVGDDCVGDGADGCDEGREMELLHAIAELGHAVSLLQLRERPAAMDRDSLPASVEVLPGFGTAALLGHVAARPGFFERLFVCRPSSLRRLLRYLDELPRPVIYDPQEMSAGPGVMSADAELALTSSADVILAVPPLERGGFAKLRERLAAALAVGSPPPRVVRDVPSRKVFLDCGTHYGEGLRELAGKLGIDASWEVHCFEANPACWWYYDRERLLDIPSLTIHRQAVWIEDGAVDVRQEDHVASASGSPQCGGPNTDGWGSTIVANNTHPGLQSPVRVPSIDLSRFIREAAMRASEIVLKLDVEGAEYAILRKMIADGSLDYVDRLFVEFHWRLLPSESMDSTLALRAEIERRFPKLLVKGWG